MKPRLRQMLNELERAAELKSVKIQPITMRLVTLLYQEDEPLVGEFLRSKKGVHTGANFAFVEDMVPWLEKQGRFADVRALWEKASDYWQKRLESEHLSEYERDQCIEKVEEALQALNRLHERSNAEAASP